MAGDGDEDVTFRVEEIDLDVIADENFRRKKGEPPFTWRDPQQLQEPTTFLRLSPLLNPRFAVGFVILVDNTVEVVCSGKKTSGGET
jgi:hypothetical protein